MNQILENNILEPYEKVLNTNKRYYLIAGGRAGGRSYFASQYAYTSLLTRPYFRCAIMRYVQGDIRNSIYQEIIDRLEEQELINQVSTTTKPISINFKNNTINGIGFRKSSSDQKAKLKSLAGYNTIIVEEADETNEEDFQQLDESLRTVKGDIKIILLFNFPHKDHWIIKRWFNLLPTDIDDFYKPELKDSVKHNTEYIYSSYKDNPNLDRGSIDLYESYKETKPDHYWNMIMGLVPAGKRGLIYKNWQPISVKEYEELDYPVYYGLDYGFSNDCAGLVEVKSHNNRIYFRELIYETGLLNKSLSDKMEAMGIDKRKAIIYSDREPKSIAELRSYGWNVIGADKGAGSRKAGVNFLLEKEVYYTENSVNLIKEKNEYCWQLDKDKNPTNEPSDGNDHILDGCRYAVTMHANRKIITII